jgi:DNA-binding MarR family transcriptional regulator
VYLYKKNLYSKNTMTVYQNKLSFNTGPVVKMLKNSGNSPANSFSALQERALDLIGSRGDGLFQSELRRLMSIDSSKCSKIVCKMQSSGLIYREKVPASSTYLIKLTRPVQELSFDKPARRNIDSYLTEFYLLYLVRGISG